MSNFIINPYLDKQNSINKQLTDLISQGEIIDFHKTIRGYNPTPLVSLSNIAKEYGVKNLLVKDESKRFGVNAFKPLGASFAIYKLIKEKWEENFKEEFKIEYLYDKNTIRKLGDFVFVAASDGNHGKAVAWMANMIGQKAKIFMPKGTKQARIDHIENEGAEVIIIDGTYDDCVREVSVRSEKYGWYEIGDTAYGKYTEIPTFVATGYSTIFYEIKKDLDEGKFNIPDIVFLQAGVGAFALSGIVFFKIKYHNKNIKFICVEPDEAAGFFDSIRFGDGNFIEAKGKMETIMAGLNCGIPSSVAWPVLKYNVNLFMTISDKYAKEAMRKYRKEGIISGESGAAGLGGFLSLSDKKDIKNILNLNKNSTVLLINTEGDTDPKNYKKIIEG